MLCFEQKFPFLFPFIYLISPSLFLLRHEHECLVRPTRSLAGGFFISQPGSSVATSLSEGEATPKQVGVLDVKAGNFRLFPVPLRQVCVMFFRSSSLQTSLLSFVAISLSQTERPPLSKSASWMSETETSVSSPCLCARDGYFPHSLPPSFSHKTKNVSSTLPSLPPSLPLPQVNPPLGH